MSAESKLKEMQKLKEKNLLFLEKFFPDIHKSFKNKSLERLQLNIDPKNMAVNLLEQGHPLYSGDADEVCKDEAAEFSQAFAIGASNQPLRHHFAYELNSGRFGHGTINRFLKSIDAQPGSERPFQFEHSLPQVVFLGSGVGLHIKHLLNIRKVRHAVLVEHDPDKFLSSLYLTDWDAILTPYIEDKSTSFTLSVGDTTSMEEDKRVHSAFAAAWNHTCLNVPFMPVQTVFYVHQADAFYTKVANRLNDEIEPYINVWGYYDDEINQLNHVLHNLNNGVPIIKKLDLSDDDRLTIVCGNGPSLDQAMGLFKEHREKLILIAGGSSIQSLTRNGIVPDIFATSESDLDTYEMYEAMKIDSPERVAIIGAAQVHPKTFDLFPDALIYLKQETAYSSAFDFPDSTFTDGTPSATNIALAIALELKLQNVCLVGMDFGFRDVTKTHSESSYYRDDNMPGSIQDYLKSVSRDHYLLSEEEGVSIYTTPFYNTSRVHAERKILRESRYDVKNLTKGASITGTEEITLSEFSNMVNQLSPKSNKDIFKKLKENSVTLKQKEVSQKTHKIFKSVSEICKKTNKISRGMTADIDSIERSAFEINQVLSNPKRLDDITSTMMLRGTIWYMLFNLYAIAKQTNRDEYLEDVVASWKKHFNFLTSEITNHFYDFISVKSENDERLLLTITQSEPNIEALFEKIEEY